MLALNKPDVPVIVTVPLPGVAFAAAVRVSTLAPVVEFGEMAAVTPAGRRLAAKFTLPANPFTGVTVSPDIWEVPAASSTSVGPVIVKPSAFTVSGTVMDALYVPEVPVIVTVKVPGVAVLPAVRVRKLS